MPKYGYRKTAACMLDSCCVRRRMRSVEAAGTESCRRRQSATFRARGDLDKRGWSPPRTMRASGSCYKEVNVHGKADRHMKLLTFETESKLGTFWDQEECNQFCSKEELWESARDEEMKIPWQEANEGPPVPKEQYQERFWRRRDGIGLDTATKEFLAIEFKRTQDASVSEKQLRVESNRGCSGAVQEFDQIRVSKRLVKSKG
jgi:hypothetical protein